MATFQDPYANADYIATLLSGQVSGGYLQKNPDETNYGFWKATSTNLGLNFSATAITGLSYTPNQSAGAVGRLQFSTDGSNVKAIDGSNIDVGAYDFDLLEYMYVNADSSLDNMANGGVTFSIWVKPDPSGNASGRIWCKGGVGDPISPAFGFSLNGESGAKWKLFLFHNTTGAVYYTHSDDYVLVSDKWNHVALKWNGVAQDAAVIYVNGVLIDVTWSGPDPGTLATESGTLTISSPESNNDLTASVSDLIFWLSELTDTQMKEIYLYSKIPSGFAARYRLADTTTAVDGVIIDDVGNNNMALKCTDS